MTQLDGAVVLVLGADGGLGSRIAARLADAGATVVSAGRADGELKLDIRAKQAAERIVSATLSAHGKLDGLVIAAGVVAFGPASEVTDATIDELFQTNTAAPIRFARASFPALAESATAGREPFLVTLSGIVAEQPVAGIAAYSASKAGLAAYVVAAAREYRRSGIRLLDARPGHTGTSLSEHPIAGEAPQLASALDPDAVAERIVRAIADGEKDLPSSAFVTA